MFLFTWIFPLSVQLMSLWLCRYEHLAKSAATILDDSLSADAYLNVLYMPSTFPRSERSRQSARSASSQLISDSEDGPRSNLDNNRFLECKYYLQEVSSSFSFENLNGISFHKFIIFHKLDSVFYTFGLLLSTLTSYND